VKRKRKTTGTMRWSHILTDEILYLIVGYDLGITFRLFEILKIIEGRK
jgi:hypothetical protein